MVGQKVGETLYHLHISAKNSQGLQEDTANAVKLNIATVHQRFAHLNCSDIIKMKKMNAVKDLELELKDSLVSCEACIFGKMHRTSFPTNGSGKASEVCDLIHGDVGEPIHVPTFDDYKYYSLLKDDCSNFIDVIFLRRKTKQSTTS